MKDYFTTRGIGKVAAGVEITNFYLKKCLERDCGANKPFISKCEIIQILTLHTMLIV